MKKFRKVLVLCVSVGAFFFATKSFADPNFLLAKRSAGLQHTVFKPSASSDVRDSNFHPVLYKFNASTKNWEQGYLFKNVTPVEQGSYYVTSYGKYAWLNAISSGLSAEVYFYNGSQWENTQLPKNIWPSSSEFFNLIPAYPSEQKDSPLIWSSNVCKITPVTYNWCTSLFDGKTWSTPVKFPAAIYGGLNYSSQGSIWSLYPTSGSEKDLKGWFVSASNVTHPSSWTTPVPLGTWEVDGDKGIDAYAGKLFILVHSPDKNNTALITVSSTGAMLLTQKFTDAYLNQMRIAGNTIFIRGVNTVTHRPILYYRNLPNPQWVVLPDPFVEDITGNGVEGWAVVGNNILCGISEKSDSALSAVTCISVSAAGEKETLIPFPSSVQITDPTTILLSPDGKTVWINDLTSNRDTPYIYFYNLAQKNWVKVTQLGLTANVGAVVPEENNNAIVAGRNSTDDMSLSGFYFDGAHWISQLKPSFPVQAGAPGTTTGILSYSMSNNGDLVRGLSSNNSVFAFGWSTPQ